MSNWLMILEVDTNDADYVYFHRVITQEEHDRYVKELIPEVLSLETVGDSMGDPGERYGISDEKVDEITENFYVSTENGYHTIESVTFFELADSEREYIYMGVGWNTTW